MGFFLKNRFEASLP